MNLFNQEKRREVESNGKGWIYIERGAGGEGRGQGS
jgi:hypothetical protein